MQERGESKLLTKLNEYAHSDFYPFHMPGHKRRDCSEIFELEDFPNPYRIDITEIDGFDNLHHAEGILKESMEEMAEIYGSDQSYYLVNGSTCGILSAIFACTGQGGKILMARNCHKAAYHGAVLRHLETEYVYPQFLESYGISGGILPEDVRAILENDRLSNRGEVDENRDHCGKPAKTIQAVLIVSPTYEGVVSDIRGIADVVHEYGIPLIVDEAHGAHLPFACHDEDNENSGFPKSALDMGADIVIQSLHKTLPSFTQTAVLHVKSDIVNAENVEQYLAMFQTSSPSYLFLAAMERCVHFMDLSGREMMKQYECRMTDFFKRMKKLKVLQVFDGAICEEDSVFAWDPSKIIISTRQAVHFAKKTSEEEETTVFGGDALAELLRTRFHLEMEMAAPEYVIAMTSVFDTEEGLERLGKALEEIDEELCHEILQTVFHESLGNENKYQAEERFKLAKLPKAAFAITLADAMEKRGVRMTFSDSLDCVSKEFVYLYPPGIPILAPGEKITKEILERIMWYQSMGLSVQGLSDPSLYSIITVAEES